MNGGAKISRSSEARARIVGRRGLGRFFGGQGRETARAAPSVSGGGCLARDEAPRDGVPRTLRRAPSLDPTSENAVKKSRGASSLRKSRSATRCIDGRCRASGASSCRSSAFKPRSWPRRRACCRGESSRRAAAAAAATSSDPSKRCVSASKCPPRVAPSPRSSPRNGGSVGKEAHVAISYKAQPRPQASSAGETAAPSLAKHSGGWYASVPPTADSVGRSFSAFRGGPRWYAACWPPRAVGAASRTARPKSPTLIVATPRWIFTKMFSSLTSRWTMPRACA
mmetsp:Transcript_2697/g.9757  ORF Transcript_2697/g.9757 Transcript_2697/m.9757 type:complete len:282 (-) Transcript_2697:1204-2049(-)